LSGILAICQPARRRASCELEAAHYEALYDLGVAAGCLIPGTDADPVRRLLSELLGAYMMRMRRSDPRVSNELV
jgi:hypothetical protein